LKSTSKLSGETRRAAIIKAVQRIFAERGFHGTTTRELAAAAGVSEALLFKHFPNKEALYSAMQLSCCSEQDQGKIDRLKTLEPSASTLVFLTQHMISRILARDDEEALHNRLMLRSLTEDGEFARLFLKGMPSEMNRMIERCLQAAIAAGDAVDGPVGPRLGGWFASYLAAVLKFHSLPAEPVVEYGISRDKVQEQAVWFALRGMGLKEEAIERYYNRHQRKVVRVDRRTKRRKAELA
jgi:AcrR family transcriptional regulator